MIFGVAPSPQSSALWGEEENAKKVPKI